MACACLSSPAFGSLLCAVQLIAAMAMETNGMANITQYPPVVTATKGGSAFLPCHFPREWITRNYGVKWHKTQGPHGVGGKPRDWPEISSPAKEPRFSYGEDKASLLITPVVVTDTGVYYCTVKTVGKNEYQGKGMELRVLAPPSAPQLFLQVPPGLWSGQWNVFCVTGGFHPNQVRLSWTQDGAKSELQDCTSGSADPGPVQSNGLILQNLTLEQSPDPAPSSWLPISLVMETKPRPYQRCIHVTDSSNRGPYLVSVLPLPLGPAARVTYTCTVKDHPALPTTLSASLNWELPSSEVIRCLNIAKICILSSATLAFTLAALNWLYKKRKPGLL